MVACVIGDRLPVIPCPKLFGVDLGVLDNRRHGRLPFKLGAPSQVFAPGEQGWTLIVHASILSCSGSDPALSPIRSTAAADVLRVQ